MKLNIFNNVIEMKCPHCGCENPNSYKYCHDCGCPLNYSDFREEYNFKSNNINQTIDFGVMDNVINTKKLIIIGYIIAILFGWGTLLISLLFGKFGFFGFFGLFFPGFMLNSQNPSLRKHAYIQLIITLIGIIFTFLVLFH